MSCSSQLCYSGLYIEKLIIECLFNDQAGVRGGELPGQAFELFDAMSRAYYEP